MRPPSVLLLMIKYGSVLLVVAIVVTAAVFIAAAGTTCNGRLGDYTCLTVHSDVDLGTINSSVYHDPTPTGGGQFVPIESDNNAVSVTRNGWLTLDWTLTVEIVAASPGVDLTRFYWRGGDQPGYTVFPGAQTPMTVVNGRNVTGTDAEAIDYRYLPSADDLPGTYSITLRYQVAVSIFGYPLYTVSQDVTITWTVQAWIVVAAHGAIDLGTVTGALYDVRTGKLAPLESDDNPVFVIGNPPSGWQLQLEVTAITTPPGFSGDLLTNFYWRVDNGAFHSAAGLNTTPVTLVSRAGPGGETHRISYRYQPDTADRAGTYGITLRYTVTTR